MSSNKNLSRSIAVWLFLCCGMIFVMALIGAITRLTESGLSITDWNPILGAIPPLTAREWQSAFDAYQLIPQFRLLHSDMDLQAFKHIYFWEWLHRLWGRLIGVVFALPLIWFALRRKIKGRLAVRLVLILIFIGFQGFVGWYMVESGLDVRTDVSPYRLAFHLGCAVLIYAFILWTALGISEPAKVKSPGTASELVHGWVAVAFLAVTMVWGAFVAGLHAGLAYNTWPLMDGDVLPSAAFTLLPKWHNLFENLALVQFLHRWLGPTTMVVLLSWVGRVWTSQSQSQQKWLLAVALISVLQVMLGISTLMSHLNIALAVSHQAGALTLLSVTLIALAKFKPLR